MSPFRKITQQLNDLELKSPELEDFSTPVVAPPDLWPRAKTPTTHNRLIRSNSLTQLRTSPSLNLDIDAIHNLQHTVRAYNEHLQRKAKQQSSSNNRQMNNKEDDLESETEMEATFQSLPVNINSNNEYSNSAYYNVHDEIEEDEMNSSIKLIDLDEAITGQTMQPTTSSRPINAPLRHSLNEYEHELTKCSVLATHNVRFLDTKMMSTSPSANYYRPTEEPEPLDLTQLNIEASVMCLVSKIKFLCGRCGSPAIRLRHPKGTMMKRSGFINHPVPDVLDNGNSQQAVFQCDETTKEEISGGGGSSPNGNTNGLNLDLTHVAIENEPVKKGNKFTDGMCQTLLNNNFSFG